MACERSNDDDDDDASGLVHAHNYCLRAHMLRLF